MEGKRLPVPVGVPETPLDWSFRLVFRYTLRYKPSIKLEESCKYRHRRDSIGL
jgi:hypothetical protein